MNPADLTEAHGESLMCTYLGYKLERREEVSGGRGWPAVRPSDGRQESVRVRSS